MAVEPGEHMKRWHRSIALGSLVLSTALVANQVVAQQEAITRFYFPASRLVEICTHDENSVSTAQCVGYLSAVADTEMQRLQFTGKAYFCRPTGVTIGRLRNIFLAYAKAHPERADVGAANMVTFAWQGAFPCPASQASQ